MEKLNAQLHRARAHPRQSRALWLSVVCYQTYKTSVSLTHPALPKCHHAAFHFAAAAARGRTPPGLHAARAVIHANSAPQPRISRFILESGALKFSCTLRLARRPYFCPMQNAQARRDGGVAVAAAAGRPKIHEARSSVWELRWGKEPVQGAQCAR